MGIAQMKSTDMARRHQDAIADVQNSADSRQIPIDKVGIKDIIMDPS